jgi:hypothetical protein
MTTSTIQIDTGTGRRVVRLADYVAPADEERAIEAAHRWIKELRHLPVDGQPLRRRFTFRGDSLWWFTELYLHKRDVIRRLFRTTAAIENLVEREHPTELAVRAGDRLVRGIAWQIARAHGVCYAGRDGFGAVRARMFRLNLRATVLTYAARVSRLRPRRHVAGSATLVAFVHRAFWRGEGSDGSAESYIGPVLDVLEHRLPPGALRYIAVGPASNFAERRWWQAVRQPRVLAGLEPVESYAPLRALRPSARIWRERHAMLRALCNSAEVREHAIVNGVDWWPAVREELAGVALLQWPWSARTMDEAGAALDALKPHAAMTYAEAGGWGRALMLECRRRGIPSVGLQHGFIYRHWLNYLHEPDEMTADTDGAGDRGFPRPDLTLLFDGYVARHLGDAGRFPESSLRVTGSPRLDALLAVARSLSAATIAEARRAAGAGDAQALVLFVAKYREARHVLPPLVSAVAGMPNVQLAIKAHPAETPGVYTPLVEGRSNVRVLPPAAPLAPLLAAARAIVTVNSTVAIDAAVMGVPALVIGLPNNLSPFVDAKVMAGADDDEIGPALSRILYDEGFRQQIGATRSVFLASYDIRSDGGAAERSADAILGVIAGRR